MQDAPAQMAKVVTPNNSADLPAGMCRALFIGGQGDVSLECSTVDRTDLVFKNLSAGSILPVNAIRVNFTGTTATDILALY